MTAPTRFRTGVLGEGFDSALTSTAIKRAVDEGASLAVPAGLVLGAPHLPKPRRRQQAKVRGPGRVAARERG
jgi:hypothetical protein